jgi:hypothetical protein
LQAGAAIDSVAALAFLKQKFRFSILGEGIRGFKSAMKAEEEKPASTTTVAGDQSVTKG